MDGTAPALRLKVQLMLGADIAMGPGKAMLLEAIETSGSIAAAGRALGISYRRTRDMVDTMNRCWGEPLVAAARGGAAGGGARLTARGRAVLEAYRALVRSAEDGAQSAAGPLLALTHPPG